MNMKVFFARQNDMYRVKRGLEARCILSTVATMRGDNVLTIMVPSVISRESMEALCIKLAGNAIEFIDAEENGPLT